MELDTVEAGGVTAVEGRPGAAFMASAADVRTLLEWCFSAGSRAALLYAENLPSEFFDLSSGVAGEVLQKLRNYHVRLAVVAPPGSVRFSSRFGELLEEARRGPDFGVFETREAARAWLAES
jgi:hypothetical protein